MSVHLVAVLGFSGRRGESLHEVCAERLRHAEELAHEADAVLISGWRRRRVAMPEADLMRAAWRGPDVPLIADRTARSTKENAQSVADTAKRLGATEVTVVTSRWHAFRARTLVRTALPGVTVRSSSPRGRLPVRLLARELVCISALPYHLLRVRARRT